MTAPRLLCFYAQGLPQAHVVAYIEPRGSGQEAFPECGPGPFQWVRLAFIKGTPDRVCARCLEALGLLPSTEAPNPEQPVTCLWYSRGRRCRLPIDHEENNCHAMEGHIEAGGDAPHDFTGKPVKYGGDNSLHTTTHVYMEISASSHCARGCGAWMGFNRSGAPDGINPFGACPKAPEIIAAGPPWLPELCAALGWQGGTWTDAIAKVARMYADNEYHGTALLKARDTLTTITAELENLVRKARQ